MVLVMSDEGVVADLLPEAGAGDGIEKLHGILCPGFINAHCHLELSHMKGLIPKHTGLVDFVLKVVNGRHFDELEILAAIESAEVEMLQNGIVAVGDICNNTLTIPQKSRGRMRYHNFIEASGFPPVAGGPRFARAVDFFDVYAEKFSTNSIVPHAPYSVSPDMFRMINEFPGNDLLSIHNQETAAENELFKKGTGDLLRLYEKMGIDISFFKPPGRSSLQTWLPYFTKSQTIILVHNVVTSAQDMEFTASPLPTPDSRLPTPDSRLLAPDSRLFFCLCPNANLYISNQLPDIKMLLRHTGEIVLGTDSLASNDQLSIWEEMRTIQNNVDGMELATLLQWATSNGSRALRMQDKLGSFEKGKQPGVVLIEGVEELKIGHQSSVRRVL